MTKTKCLNLLLKWWTTRVNQFLPILREIADKKRQKCRRLANERKCVLRAILVQANFNGVSVVRLKLRIPSWFIDNFLALQLEYFVVNIHVLFWLNFSLKCLRSIMKTMKTLANFSNATKCPRASIFNIPCERFSAIFLPSRQLSQYIQSLALVRAPFEV